MNQLTDVEVVDVLFGDVIAAEPGEVVPVVDLVFHLGGFAAEGLGDGAARAGPDAAAVPVALGAR